MDWFTSDLHLMHDKGFIYSPRGFMSVEDMDNTIVKNFNEVVKWDDNLYILGDLMLNNNDGGMRLLRQLPGKKIIIAGNHDTDARIALYQKEPSMEYLGIAARYEYKGYHFYLSHYPTVTQNFDDSDKPLKRRIFCLSGHTHSKDKWDPRTDSYNVALDAHENYPVSIEQIISEINGRFYKK